MTVVVLSKHPLTLDDQQKIREIFQQSQCPNESLSYTFENRYYGMFGGTIRLDSANGNATTVVKY